MLRDPAIACGSFCAILGAQKGSGFALLKKRFAALRPPNAILYYVNSFYSS
ncbi:hypothetical protein HMPREF9554_00878 [Treponema phagedenis F0421]|nr:hypothetical protein HMPREF9554_00878 [Treponema phagedenis F0421]